MKPKNKFQKLVVDLKVKLKPISDEVRDWGLQYCFEHVGCATKSKAGCYECGHEWNQKSTLINTLVGCECPSCGKELKLEVTRKKKYERMEYYAVLTVVGGFQVVRMYYLIKRCRIGHDATFHCSEVMQHWIDEKGKTAIFSKLVNGFSNCYDNWILNSDLELRGTLFQGSELRCGIVPHQIHPKKKILPAIKRNGFKANYYGISPIRLFSLLLSDSKAETLLKSNQIPMLKFYFDRYANLGGAERLWGSIKICIRNGYIITNPSIWRDYIDLLAYFNKDLLSSHYVCPIDLKGSHDKLVRKKTEVEKRRRLADIRKGIAEAQIDYQKAKGIFFGVAFSDGDLSVRVMQSVEEFQEEGAILKHCVFANEYYKKPDSLILSARVGDLPVETVEISLSKLKIVQARGAGNTATVYNEAIRNLVNSNLHVIRRLINKQN